MTSEEILEQQKEMFNSQKAMLDEAKAMLIAFREQEDHKFEENKIEREKEKIEREKEKIERAEREKKHYMRIFAAQALPALIESLTETSNTKNPGIIATECERYAVALWKKFE